MCYVPYTLLALDFFGVSIDYLDELLAVSRVTDLSASPDAYRRTVQSQVTISGVLIPLINATNLDKMFGVAEDYLCDPNHFNRDLLSATMRTILDRARAHNPPPTTLEYLNISPQDYTIHNAADPPVRVMTIHTRPEQSWFLALMDYQLVLGESLGRMRVFRAVEQGGHCVYPIVIRTKWRALTNQRVIKRLRDVWQDVVKHEA